MMNPDGILARRPWNSLPEKIVDDQLAEFTMGRGDIHRIAPPIANIGWTAPRFGGPDYTRRQLGINDVAHLDDMWPKIDHSGDVSGFFSGTCTPAYEGM